MTLKDLLLILQKLLKLQSNGGSNYKQITSLLDLEATTYNCKQALKLYKQLSKD